MGRDLAHGLQTKLVGINPLPEGGDSSFILLCQYQITSTKFHLHQLLKVGLPVDVGLQDLSK